MALDPAIGFAGTTTVTLIQVPADAVGSTTVDGGPGTVSTSQGQNGHVSFSVPAGKRVFVSISNSYGDANDLIALERPFSGLLVHDLCSLWDHLC